MKKINLLIFASVVVFTCVVAGCDSRNQSAAKNDATQQNKTQTSIVLNYTDSANARITANIVSFRNFKGMLEEQNNDCKEDMSNRLTEIEHKNDDMQDRLDAYNNDTDEALWVAFKVDFTSRMDSIDQEFKSLTVSND